MDIKGMRSLMEKIAAGTAEPTALLPELPGLLTEVGGALEKTAAENQKLQQRLTELELSKRAEALVRDAEARNITIQQLTGKTAESFQDKVAAVLVDPAALPVLENQVKYAGRGSSFELGNNDTPAPSAGSGRVENYNDIARRVMDIHSDVQS